MTWTRSLSAVQQNNIRKLRDEGWRVPAIAHLYGVSKRTIYRYMKGDLVDVTVGRFSATFLIEPGRNPRRAGPWREA